MPINKMIKATIRFKNSIKTTFYEVDVSWNSYLKWPSNEMIKVLNRKQSKL